MVEMPYVGQEYKRMIGRVLRPVYHSAKSHAVVIDKFDHVFPGVTTKPKRTMSHKHDIEKASNLCGCN